MLQPLLLLPNLTFSYNIGVMPVCKHFLQGTCRYGNNCKFSHQLVADGGPALATSVLLRNNYSNENRQPVGASVDVNTLVKSVSNDMTCAEKGGQWLLSSYAPFKEKADFPGFKEYSMEEIRFMYYEAAKNGTLEQFKSSLQEILREAIMQIRALQNPTPDVVEILKSIYNGAAANTHATSNSMFAQTPPLNDNANVKPTGIFGNTLQQTNANMNTFKSIFQQPPPHQTSAGIFQQQQWAPSQTPANNPIFHSNQNSNSYPIFNQANTNQIAPVLQQSAVVATGSIFQQPLINPPVNNSGIQQPTPSIFGPSNTSSFRDDDKNKDFYSKREELTAEEIQWYEGDDMDYTKIPTKPPTFEMCFPT